MKKQNVVKVVTMIFIIALMILSIYTVLSKDIDVRNLIYIL